MKPSCRYHFAELVSPEFRFWGYTPRLFCKECGNY
jgi:hypothetical protein